MNDQDEMFERATETPAFLGVSAETKGRAAEQPLGQCPQHMPTKLPSGFDGVEPGEDVVNPSRLDDIGMQMDETTVVDDDGVVCKIRRAGVLMMGIGRPAQLWEIDATKHPTCCRVMVFCDHKPIFDGKAFGKNLHRAGLLGLAVMIRFIQAQRKHQRKNRRAAVKKLIKEELA